MCQFVLHKHVGRRPTLSQFACLLWRLSGKLLTKSNLYENWRISHKVTVLNRNHTKPAPIKLPQQTVKGIIFMPSRLSPLFTMSTFSTVLYAKFKQYISCDAVHRSRCLGNKSVCEETQKNPHILDADFHKTHLHLHYSCLLLPTTAAKILRSQYLSAQRGTQLCCFQEESSRQEKAICNIASSYGWLYVSIYTRIFLHFTLQVGHSNACTHTLLLLAQLIPVSIWLLCASWCM